MDDGRARRLEELAAALRERGCRGELWGETLSVHPPASARGERVIACDGVCFRWGGERGIVLGRVSDVGAAADAAVKVLKSAGRWS